ncbi:CRISPR-associated protein Cas5 [Thermanaerothrix daxensis]|uniref:CRISPR-associated protein Cas5 n=1 Tax=Thermanaerothrix daxensis TaxID=869279 RepID=A0A0P6YJM5_9CHLR|nr:CRISPR-associated protein Cas5 [Thermanaerothrix daxensis]KPL82636.1 CRISPR-associated protein Cas5 [Thermanaerothrix daxensis]
MRALKIVAEGLTASFRYPHFMFGVQPTFEMPPPATLYGHIASALGEWFDPQGVRFAVRFQFLRKQADIETTYLLTPAGGRLPGNRAFSKVLEGNANPFKREILFFPRMTLYLNRPEWLDAFRQPRYAVCLGRSQDLFTYRKVEVVDLQSAEEVVLEHTLLPYTYAAYTAAGQAVLMPRLLDYTHKRYPTFERYIILHRRVHTRHFTRYEGQPVLEPWLADPTEPVGEGEFLGVVWLSWV